ncbi:hypothetical protein KC319_g80 [Hortaea werneckii]|uniref:Heterokaryon incompatibility domain-containing protein n=1 Tax=Hortaea werneckii TaxID=91943 RepID=A0A3M7H231_HORWE|nr:hypothetical protein KC323_g6621 [Hortaea werneckii]KAI7294640.1 hypothetical protein KC352_g1058 [Hortaea werneckii]KAI7684126.1 hypothetical protein KC319_g80 [Hortaea werneckii]KAI7724128.1 hypothetical protein KC322_g272 [Hortaea werneckii]RMZ07450.1 hypothetical protein D0862_04273 [Hortaea werneckii]
MRLINTETLEMHEFLPAHIPRYAILSHRWQEEEVSFKQYTKRQKYPEIQRLKGFAKIEQFCRIARERRKEWAWIDTCCIDSRSSAELSEAINSMWRWYNDAAECYIYLCDVHMKDDFSDVLAQVERSEWFTRGWTLQELLAPRFRVLFTAKWVKIGFVKSWPDYQISRSSGKGFSNNEECSQSLEHKVSRIANVPLSCLVSLSVESFSVGERLSWSANRRTSRPEDVAYSLMGILGVNMPLLYGEGEQKAFIRLQLELLKKSNDTSLFAWDFHEDSKLISGGLLALSPANFARFHRGPNEYHYHWISALLPFQESEVSRAPVLAPTMMTNRGLYLKAEAYRMHSHKASWGRVLWCIPLSRQRRAILLAHPAGLDPRCTPVSATRTFLLGLDVLSEKGLFLLDSATAEISDTEDFDASLSLEVCEFYVEQDYV